MANASDAERLEHTPGTIEAVVRGRDASHLATRPAETAWSPTEIICHLRDVEELFQTRFHTILALDEPSIFVFGASLPDLAPWRITDRADHPLDPDRWAEDRQYRRQDAQEALAAFTRRRGIVLALLRSLSPADWDRGGIHLSRGRLTLREWVASLVGHDENHLAQLRRALDGEV
jgi:hypothetical protein